MKEEEGIGKRLWLFNMLDNVGIRGRDLEIDRKREDKKRRYLRWVMELENNARLHGKRGTARAKLKGKAGKQA